MAWDESLVNSLVYDAPGEAGEAHWNEEARALISGIILSIVTSEPASTRNVAPTNPTASAGWWRSIRCARTAFR